MNHLQLPTVAGRDVPPPVGGREDEKTVTGKQQALLAGQPVNIPVEATTSDLHENYRDNFMNKTVASIPQGAWTQCPPFASPPLSFLPSPLFP